MYQEYLEANSVEPYRPSGDVYAPYLKAYKKLGGMFGTQMWDRTVANSFRWKPLEFNFHEQEDMSPIRNDEAPNIPSISVFMKFLIRRSQFRKISPTSLIETLSNLRNLEQLLSLNSSVTAGVAPLLLQQNLALDGLTEPEDRCVDVGEETPAFTKVFILGLAGVDQYIVFDVNTVDLAKHLWNYGLVKSSKKGGGGRLLSNPTEITQPKRNYGRHLEHISVSFLIDAEDFFYPLWTSQTECTTTWEISKTLSLTSRILKSYSRSRVNGLLCAAADAAMKMPKLQLLELWGCDEGVTSVFRYRVKDTVTEITWLSTHITKVDQKVINVWTSVAVAQGDPTSEYRQASLAPTRSFRLGLSCGIYI
ncbi:hypothetical protein NCS52_00177300 [Fusarium sp. LHS14.1]|nr:hypothetical protein NCS52_00177300 [Fusarium sp. LHS14.1]